MFNFLSKKKKDCPSTISIDDFNALTEKVEGNSEVLSQFMQDLATVNTSIQRIERKQNRWLDILNLKEPPSNGQNTAMAAAIPAANVAPAGGDEIAGYPTED